jgi:hypothetical protein
MNISSAQPDYSITSSDTISLSPSYGVDTLTIDTATMANITAAAGSYTNVTIGGSSGSMYYTSPITINGISALTTAQISGITSIDTSSFTIKFPEEWEDKFPDFDRIQKMCKEYPGLAIAFEKFKTTYLLVKNHYDTPEDQRPKP